MQNVFNTLHVNYWGNPGVGKSGLAGQLYGRLSEAGYLVELVKEYAKELYWKGALVRRDDRTGEIVEEEQLLITTEQFRREAEYDSRVQVIVTDSPVLQGLVFAPSHYRGELTNIMRQLTAGWTSIDILVNKDLSADYQSGGRIQTSQESMALRPEIEMILKAERPDYLEMNNKEAADRAYEIVVDRLERGKVYEATI